MTDISDSKVVQQKKVMCTNTPECAEVYSLGIKVTWKQRQNNLDLNSLRTLEPPPMDADIFLFDKQPKKSQNFWVLFHLERNCAIDFITFSACPFVPALKTSDTVNPPS